MYGYGVPGRGMTKFLFWIECIIGNPDCEYASPVMFLNINKIRCNLISFQVHLIIHATDY